jgi:DNA-binding response OmpR family regulator
MKTTILIIHHEPHILKLVKANLERSGYKVLTAPNDETAREIMEREKPYFTINLDKEGMNEVKELIGKQ